MAGETGGRDQGCAVGDIGDGVMVVRGTDGTVMTVDVMFLKARGPESKTHETKKKKKKKKTDTG